MTYIKVFSIFLAISSVLAFLFEFIFPISYLPITFPYEGLVDYLGVAGLYMEVVFLGLIAISLSNKVRSLLPLGLALIISPALDLFHNYSLSPYWSLLEIILALLGVASLIEVTIKSNRRTLLFLPTLIMVILTTYAGIDVVFLHGDLVICYLYVLIASLVGITTYAVIYNKIVSKRAMISYIAAIPGLFVFLPLYFVVVNNRFLEIIMNMVIPSAFGITLYNPYLLPLLLIVLSVSIYSVILLAIKGNGYAGLGYFIILTTVFQAITGFHLLLYLLAPFIGFSILNYKEIGNGRTIMDDLKKLVQRLSLNT
ncbi:cytochrome b558/566 subunit B [Acidianus sp. HS-5]|uniref:cytochrome b558/566 subunit B n=1 Tax=Acidianus sp. HS-5 TaxID=2886040 RepID=UPI001F36D92B|nr:cytochrome b558/566 subunit B [Acidianus sp. HS-5]BDC17287.1 cytochrome b558/566 subunit B [Acidianus sp. HS-5]